MRQLVTMAASDLRQRLRDKSVVIFALVVPLALMTVLNLIMGGLDDPDPEPVTVAFAAPADDDMADVIGTVLAGLDQPDVSIERHDASQIRSVVEADDADLGVIVPEGFGASVRDGAGPDVDVVQGNGDQIAMTVISSVIDATLDEFHAGTVASTAGSQLGLDDEQSAAIARAASSGGQEIEFNSGEASSEQLSLSGSLVAGQAGLFLIFTVSFGVLGLITEAEQGTLARLRSMPMRPGLIVSAKALVGFILGLVATGVLLTIGSLMFGVDFGSIPAVAAVVVCAVLAATSLVFIIVRLASTSEQASIVQSILAIVLGMAGGSFFPITATGLGATILDLNPIAAFIRGLGITSGGGGITDIGVPVAIMLGFAAVMAAGSLLLPNRGPAA